MSYSITGNLGNLLAADLTEGFLDGFISDESDLSWLRVTPTDKNEIVNVGIEPPSQYFSHPEGQDVPTESLNESEKATYTHTSLAIGFALSLQTKLTMPRELLVQFISQMGSSARRRISSDAWDILNNCLTTVGPDGKSLVADDHPSNVGSQDNSLASGLDHTGYEAAQESLMLQQTPDGLLAGYRATTLCVPTGLRVSAHQVNTAAFTSDDLQPNLSSTQGIRTIVSRDLDSASRWFLLDDRYTRLNMYVLRGPGPKIIEEDNDSLRMEIRDKMLYATGFDTWRGVVSSSA